MSDDVLRDFRDPGARHRGAPFWAWNGKLDPEELRRQIRLMKQMGLGGFFMHSRVGLATPYLSKEWFACIEACADEAKKQGMLAWLYDEDRWPSGAAGGLVTREERFRKRFLVMEELASPDDLRWTDAHVAAFVATVEGDTARGVRRIARGDRPESLGEGESVLAFRVDLEQPSSWFNGFTYLDTLSPAAVRRFLSVTHEAYRRHCAPRFGREIPGIFTDEPNHHKRIGPEAEEAPSQPWTGNLPSVFRKRYGYDLLPHLVELFLDVDGRPFTPARWHFHDCVTHLFVDSFARQIGSWCAEHGLEFTGHTLMEDTLSEQTQSAGSCLRFYEHMQLPGMDLLTERWRAFTTAKQVSSAARQFGRRWRLSETYGCTGWDFSFAGHKALGDWQAALGINYRCQHLAWYTMEGEAKRDYPAAISWQSPWWHLYPAVEDYFARINAALDRGGEVRDLLVVHPVESCWMMVRRGWLHDPRTRAYDRMLVALEDALLGAHIDFDYGDEEILSRRASVAKSGTGGGPLLKVGKAVYTTVLVPPMLTLRASTLSLLERFAAAGGLVVFAGDPAGAVDAIASEAVAALAARSPRAPSSGPELAEAVERARRVSIADAAGGEISAALYQLREDREGFVLFVCNTGLEGAERSRDIFDEVRVADRRATYPLVRIRLLAPTEGAPIELDPSTGEIWAAAATRGTDGSWTVETSLPRLASRLFWFPKRPRENLPRPRPRLVDIRRVELDGERWTIQRSEDNVLPLDRPSLRIGDAEPLVPQEVLRADRAVRQSLGIAPRGGAMVQPWCRPAPKKPKAVDIALTYRFEVDAVPSGPIDLCLEQPARWQAELNGAPLCTRDDRGWWVDPSLRRIAVDPCLLVEGGNTLVLRCAYDESHPGLEVVYLLGAFGTAAEGADARITEEPRNLSPGDWVQRGLAFYSGSVGYCRRVRLQRQADERLFVQVPDWRGVALRVVVNGKVAGTIGWEPYEMEITGCLPEGEAEADVRIEVIGHRRNSHGPLHHAKKWPTWTGPAEFVTTGESWSESWQLVPCGIMKPPVVLVRRPAREDGA